MFARLCRSAERVAGLHGDRTWHAVQTWPFAAPRAEGMQPASGQTVPGRVHAQREQQE